MDEKMTYKDAGVDTKEGELAVKLMKDYVKKTYDKGVLADIGGFGSLYQPDLSGVDTPVLVAGSDGVGTKLKLAFMMDKHGTIGIDLVAMCVNDVLCQGAKPLFFLDYVATSHVKAEKIAEIVRGVAEGCILAGCALVGGETAEMPDMYTEGEYDMAGFCVGMVDRDKIIDGKNVSEGDVMIGLRSSGLHSNGFSLVRKVFFEKGGLKVTDKIGEFDGEVLGDVLLTPTRIYTKEVNKILEVTKPKALIHITGGGFHENIPRVIPPGLCVRIEMDSWKRPKVFEVIQKLGNIEEKEMFSTFNMGIGMIAIVDKNDADAVIKKLNTEEEDAVILGDVARRD